MIKEKKKKSKYNYEKSKKQILLGYFKTVMFSLLFATILTSGLALHARNEMIKDLSAEATKQNIIDKATAQKIITQTDLLKDLKFKKYSVCLHVGKLYEAAGDYFDAQKAYELAVEKSKPNTYIAHNKLIFVLTAQDKFDKAKALLNNVKDSNNKDLIKFKTRAYLTIGDKYYSIGKFLSAAKSYEEANFYYNKFSKKDSVIDKSIQTRIIQSYIHVADIMVKSGLNSEAVRFLKKAEEYDPKNFEIRYKLAIVLSDSDPEASVKYFEPLLDEMPQNINYDVYSAALMKAANIADLDNRPTQAKYYRYKIHSIDIFVKRKVVYSDDIEIRLKAFNTKKVFFTYPIKASFSFLNISNIDIVNLTGDFVLLNKGKKVETVTQTISNKKHPLSCTSYEPNNVTVSFNKKVLTKKELENYTIQIYLYKDEKFKSLATEIKPVIDDFFAY